MTATTGYGVEQFMSDAKEILAGSTDLETTKKAIGERLQQLARREDLTRYGLQLGPTDASNGSYLLWREPPHLTLIMIRLDEGFLSPVHEHGDHWVVSCCYRGIDRWDIYERGAGDPATGRCAVSLVDQIRLEAGDVAIMPPPPRAIHSHNNLHDGDTLELIFSAAEPIAADRRMIYDVPAGTCRPSWYEVSDQLRGDHFPPRRAGQAESPS